MQDDHIGELQALTESLWRKTGLGDCIRIATTRQDDGSAHVEIIADRYDIVVTERGIELERIAGLSASGAARWFLHGMAVGHALSAELQGRRVPKRTAPFAFGRRDDGYSRWNWMAPAIEIMGRISPDLGDWTRQECRKVLRRAPLEKHEKRNARFPLPPEFR